METITNLGLDYMLEHDAYLFSIIKFDVGEYLHNNF